MKSYSQNGEDLIAKNYFGERLGTLLSLGENDGKTLSNSYALIQEGWCGLLVEPAPKAFDALQRLYSDSDDVVCVNVAVANFNGKATLYDSGTHLKKGDTSLLSSLDKKEIKKWMPTTEFSELEINIVDFKKLLELSPYKEFQLISIDCEGNDFLILEQIDLQMVGCEFLIVEFNGKDKDKYDNLVIPQGLKLVHQNAENLVYTKI